MRRRKRSQSDSSRIMRWLVGLVGHPSARVWPDSASGNWDFPSSGHFPPLESSIVPVDQPLSLIAGIKFCAHAKLSGGLHDGDVTVRTGP